MDRYDNLRNNTTIPKTPIENQSICSVIVYYFAECNLEIPGNEPDNAFMSSAD